MTPSPSGNLLRWLARVNPTTAFVLALLVLLLGAFAPGMIGGTLLLMLGAGLAALTFTTWPVQSPPLRLVRLVLLTALVTAALVKIL